MSGLDFIQELETSLSMWFYETGHHCFVLHYSQIHVTGAALYNATVRSVLVCWVYQHSSLRQREFSGIMSFSCSVLRVTCLSLSI